MGIIHRLNETDHLDVRTESVILVSPVIFNFSDEVKNTIEINFDDIPRLEAMLRIAKSKRCEDERKM